MPELHRVACVAVWIAWLVAMPVSAWAQSATSEPGRQSAARGTDPSPAEQAAPRPDASPEAEQAEPHSGSTARSTHTKAPDAKPPVPAPRESTRAGDSPDNPADSPSSDDPRPSPHTPTPDPAARPSPPPDAPSPDSAIPTAVAEPPAVATPHADVSDRAPPSRTAATPSGKNIGDPGVIGRHGRVAMKLYVPLDGVSPRDRARAATDVIQAALEHPREEDRPDELTLKHAGDRVVVVLNARPVLTLGPGDATQAGAGSVREHADKVHATLQDYIAQERSRKAVSSLVLSWSYVLFFGLVVFLTLPRLRRSARQAREWVHSHHDSIPSVHVRDFELISSGGVQNLLMIVVGAAGVLMQAGLVYVYLVVSLGLFETTQEWSDRLNEFLASPFFALGHRVAEIFPTAALSAAVFVVIIPAYQIAGQLFVSVEEGDLELSWIPPHSAHQVKRLFRMLLLLGALLLLGPIVSDSETSLVFRVGNIALWILGIGSLPMAVALLWGIVLRFGEGYERGAWLECGPIAGTIDSVTLFDVVVRVAARGSDNAETPEVTQRVPYLWLMTRPATVLPQPPPLDETIAVPHALYGPDLLPRMTQAAHSVAPGAKVEVAAIDADAIRLRVYAPEVQAYSSEAREVRAALVQALSTPASA